MHSAGQASDNVGSIIQKFDLVIQKDALFSDFLIALCADLAFIHEVGPGFSDAAKTVAKVANVVVTASQQAHAVS